MDKCIIDSETINKYHSNGAILLRGVFRDWVETLNNGLDRNLREPSATARYHRGSGQSAFFNDYCNWNRIPEYKSFIFHSPAAQIVAKLIRSKTLRLFHEHVVVKEAGNSVATPWHHDQPYFCVNGKQTCSLWISLDDVNCNTAIEYVGGSHEWGKMYEPMFFSGASLNENIQWDIMPRIDDNRRDYNILSWPTKAGDAIAFNFRTIHSAPPNITNQRRGAIAFRWLGDDVTFADRKGPTSPPFSNLNLHDGDKMDAPDFPVVWHDDEE